MKRSISKIKIKEASADILTLMLKEKDNRRKERIHVLYWLKSGQITTIGEAALRIGRNRSTVSQWLAKYESGGIEELQNMRKAPGKPSQITGAAFEALKDRVNSSKGFNSYIEIQLWLKTTFDLEVSYDTVFYVCSKKLKTSSKVPRPSNPNQDKEKVDDFKKT